MRKYIFCLIIFLVGNFSQAHQLIADKYNAYFSDATVYMVDEISNNCGLADKTSIGCVFTYSDRKRIEIANSENYLFDFERVLLHELGHNLGIANEREADLFAKTIKNLTARRL